MIEYQFYILFCKKMYIFITYVSDYKALLLPVCVYIHAKSHLHVSCCNFVTAIKHEGDTT